MSETKRLCIICCYTFQEKRNRFISDEARDAFHKFCQDLGVPFQDGGKGQPKSSSLELPFGDRITVCGDCLSLIVLYVQRRAIQLEQEKKLVKLQKTVVKALKELSVVINDVQTRINQLQNIVRNGDESCLHKTAKNESPKSCKESNYGEARSFREKIVLISNGVSRLDGSLRDYNNMILPVVSRRSRKKAEGANAKPIRIKEEANDPIYEDDDFHEPCIQEVEEDVEDSITDGGIGTDSVKQSSVLKRKHKGGVVKLAKKKPKELSFIDNDTDMVHEASIKVEVDYEMALPLALRRTPRSSTFTKRKVLDSNSEDEEYEDGEAVSETGSNFSDLDFEQGKQMSEDSSDFGSDAESIVCEVDVEMHKRPSKPKSKKKKKWNRPKNAMFCPTGMSEFKTGVVNRVLRRLKGKAQQGSVSASGGSGDDGVKRKETTDEELLLDNVIDCQSDPKQKFKVEFDQTTRNLHVHGIEIIIIDGNESALKCSLCDFTVTDAESKAAPIVRTVEYIMQDHIIGNHIGSYKCEVCYKVYATSKQFTWHKRTHRQKRHNCDICGRPFNTAYDCFRHKWHHMSKEEQEEAVRNGMKDFSKPWAELKNKPLGFQCPQCGQQFRTITELKGHEVRKHADNRERVMCNNCGKMYLPGPSLMYHELNCKKEDLKEVHECYICFKQCKNKVTLGRHIKLHTLGDKTPFICAICGKGFKSSGTLQRHGVVHTNVRPFVCDWCGSSYKCKKHLNRHQKVSCKSSNTNVKEEKK